MDTNIKIFCENVLKNLQEDDVIKIITSEFNTIADFLIEEYCNDISVDDVDYIEDHYNISPEYFFNLDKGSIYILEGLLRKKIQFDIYAITQKSDGCNTIEVHGVYNHRSYEMWVDEIGQINITFSSDAWHMDAPEEGTLTYDISSSNDVIDLLADAYHKNFEKMYATYDTPLKSISDVIKWLRLAKMQRYSVIATDLEDGCLRNWNYNDIDTLISMLQDDEKELQDKVIVTEDVSEDAKSQWENDECKEYYNNICTIPSEITPFEFFFDSEIL